MSEIIIISTSFAFQKLETKKWHKQNLKEIQNKNTNTDKIYIYMYIENLHDL